MVDTQGLGPCAVRRGGSTPFVRTIYHMTDKTAAKKSILKRETNGNILLIVTIPWETVQKAQDSVIDHLVENSNIQGFRPGKAPKKVVLEHTDPQKLQEETLRDLLPGAYSEAVREYDIRPMSNPKIHVDKLENDKPWVFTATTCEMPEIKLGEYKDKIKNLATKSKIVLPGKEQKEPGFDEIMEVISKEAKVEIPQMLVEEEVDRLLAQTLDEIKRLGLSLEQYLSSTKKTPEILKQEYTTKAENDIKVELILQKISEEENISVDDKELEEAINKAKTPEEKAYLEQNRYMLVSILRQQKTLDFLKNL